MLATINYLIPVPVNRVLSFPFSPLSWLEPCCAQCQCVNTEYHTENTLGSCTYNMKSSLPYQLLLYLGSYYFACFLGIELLLLIYKTIILPYKSFTLFSEVTIFKSNGSTKYNKSVVYDDHLFNGCMSRVSEILIVSKLDK